MLNNDVPRAKVGEINVGKGIFKVTEIVPYGF